MTWTVIFYSEKVEHETLALPPSILASFLWVTELMEEFGSNVGRPNSSTLSNGLLEFRATGKERIALSVFCTVMDEEIVVLMTVVKKSNKIPKRHMATALKRMKEIQDD